MDTSLKLCAVLLFVSVSEGGQLLGTYNLIPSTYNSFHNGPIFPRGGIIRAPIEEDIKHPAVVENSVAESQLPPELLNPFYKNPAIASALARESWFANKEFPVHHREAERIPREEIYKIVARLQH